MVAGPMSNPRRWQWFALWLLVVLGLPLAGRWWRQETARGCAIDGRPIEPLYRVRCVEASGTPRDFCCVLCAQAWLKERPTCESMAVTDETSGRTLPASMAFFVRSSVVTQPATGNRWHVFAREADALQHAREGRGVVVRSEDRPLP